MAEINTLRQNIAQQAPQLPWPPEIPNITYEEALSNEIRARQIAEQARILFNEASVNYLNYRNFNTNNINDNTLQEDVEQLWETTSDLFTHTRENRNNATRIVNHLEFRPLNTLI
jgi:hypothetical protein